MPRKAVPSSSTSSSAVSTSTSTRQSSPKMDEESQANWARWAGAMEQGAWLGDATGPTEVAGGDISLATSVPVAMEYSEEDGEDGDDFDSLTRTTSLDERRADQRYSLIRPAMRARLESAPEARHKRDRSHFSIPDVTVTTADDEGQETHFEVKVPPSHRRSFVFKNADGQEEEAKNVLGLGAMRRAKGGINLMPKPLINLDSPPAPSPDSPSFPDAAAAAAAEEGTTTVGTSSTSSSSSTSRMRKSSLPLLFGRGKKSSQEEKEPNSIYGSTGFDSSSSLPSSSSSSSKDSLPSSSGGQTVATSPTSSETLGGPANKQAAATVSGTSSRGGSSQGGGGPTSRFSEGDESRPRSTTPTATSKTTAAMMAASLTRNKKEQKARAKEEMALIKELERVDKMVRKHDEKRQKVEARQEKKREKEQRKQASSGGSQKRVEAPEVAVPQKENRAFKVLRRMTILGSSGSSSKKPVAQPLPQPPPSILQRRRDDIVLPQVTITPSDNEAGWTNIPSPSDTQPLAPSADLTRRSSVQRALAKMDAERASLRRQSSKKHVVGGHTPKRPTSTTSPSTPASSRSTRRENSDGWEDDEGAIGAGRRLQEALSLQQQIAAEDVPSSEGRDGQITPRPRDYSMRRVIEARSPTPEQQQVPSRNIQSPEPTDARPISFSRPFFTKAANAYPSPPTSPTSPISPRSPVKMSSGSPPGINVSPVAARASPPRTFKRGASPEGFAFPQTKSPTSSTAVSQTAGNDLSSVSTVSSTAQNRSPRYI